jgi:hypothetical protein
MREAFQISLQSLSRFEKDTIRFLVEEVELVGAVIDKVDAIPVGDNCQAEEATGSLLAEDLGRDLGTSRGDFYDIAIVAVYGQDVTVGGDG